MTTPELARARLADLRADTERRLAGLEREFRGIVEAAESANADDEHDPEGATIAFERQHADALITAARERLAEIDAALARVNDGSYGRCVACGQPIGGARLDAQPAASVCIGCASGR